METDDANRRHGRGGLGFRTNGHVVAETPGDERQTRFRERLTEFPRERGQLLPALWAAQETLGWVTGEAIVAIAGRLRIPVSEVDGVASAYPDLQRAEPVPTVRVCSGPACTCTGAELLATALARGVRIERVPCLFACTQAPAIEIGEHVYGRMTVGRAIRLAASALPEGDER